MTVTEYLFCCECLVLLDKDVYSVNSGSYQLHYCEACARKNGLI